MDAKSDNSDTFSKVQARTRDQKFKFLETLESDRVAGNVLVASYIVGISRDTAYEWRRNDPEFANKWDLAIVHSREKRVEYAEDKLEELVRKGNITAIMYTLKRLKPEVYDRDKSDDVVVGTPLHKMSPRFAKVVERLMKSENIQVSGSI